MNLRRQSGKMIIPKLTAKGSIVLSVKKRSLVDELKLRVRVLENKVRILKNDEEE